jgi:AbrB family looped-hinge helix DNA binding protein
MKGAKNTRCELLKSLKIAIMHANTSANGQIVIPSVLRQKYGIKKGTRVEFLEEGGKIVLLPSTMEQFDQALDRVRRRLKGVDLIAALEQERAEERKREDR